MNPRLTPSERMHWHQECARTEEDEIKDLKAQLKKAEKRKANSLRLLKLAVIAWNKEFK